MIIKEIKGPTSTSDGRITSPDVTTLVNIILGREPGTETGDFSDDPATGPANAPRRK